VYDDGSDHHGEDEEICANQEACHGAPDDLDGVGMERFGDCEGRGTECGIGEDEGIPRHCKLELSMTNAGPMGKDGDEEEPDSQATQSADSSTKKARLTPITIAPSS
jgi:hypothetical protein